MRKIIKKKITKGFLLFLLGLVSSSIQGQHREYGGGKVYTEIADYLEDNPCVSVGYDHESVYGEAQLALYMAGHNDFENSLIKKVYDGVKPIYHVPISGTMKLNFDGCGASSSSDTSSGFDDSGNWDAYGGGGDYGIYPDSGGGDGSGDGGGGTGGYVPVELSLQILRNRPLTQEQFFLTMQHNWSKLYYVASKENQNLITSDGKILTGVLNKFSSSSGYTFYYFTPYYGSSNFNMFEYYFIPDKIGDLATTNRGGFDAISRLGISYTYDNAGFPKGKGYVIKNIDGTEIGITLTNNVEIANLENLELPLQATYNQKFELQNPFAAIKYKIENGVLQFPPMYEQFMLGNIGELGANINNLLQYYKKFVNTTGTLSNDPNIIIKQLESYLAGNGALSPTSQEFIDWVVSATAIQIGAVNNNFEILKAPEFSSPFAEDNDFAKVNDPFFTNKPDDPWRLKKYLSPNDTYFIGLVAGLGDGVIETADLAYTIVKFGVKNSPATLLIRLVTDTDNVIKEKIEEVKVVKDLVSVIYDKPKQEQIYNSIKAAVGNWFDATTFQKTNVQAGYEQGKILFEILGAFVGITEVKTLLQTGKFSATALTKIAEIKGLFNFGNKLKKIEGVSALVDNAGAVIVKGDKAVETFMNVKYMQKGLRPAPNTYMEATHISNHLRKFDGGVTKFISYNPSGTVGPPGGTFVLPKSQADNLIAQAGGDVNKLTDLLGLNRGDLGTSPYRINIDKPSGLRMPDGNEAGANINWVPGGKTSGGILEATIDQIQPGTYNKHLVF